MVLYLGENIKKLREERNITQTNFANYLSVSRKTVSHWETGYTEPPISQLIAIARYFEVTVDDLLCEKL